MSKFNRKEYFREYRNAHRKKIRKYNRKYNKLWRKKNGYHNEIKWVKNNEYKVKAKTILRLAVKANKVKKLRCKICYNKKVVGHHPDYKKPLKVIWLCPLHHKQIHLQLKYQKNK